MISGGSHNSTDPASQAAWLIKIKQQLPLLGHRNWIVIADSAYPWQTAPGIETTCTGVDHFEVVQTVLGELRETEHLKPSIYFDAELRHVPEQYALGITSFRQRLAAILADHDAQSLPHEQIIAKLDEAGNKFRVLLLKTNLALPYTSVFIELGCGYTCPELDAAVQSGMSAGS